MHLLKGKVLNINNVFKTIGLTNAPREISRMIEKPFGVEVSREPKEGKSRYGQPVRWFNYKLERTERNKEGIEKMEAYVMEQTPGTTVVLNNGNCKTVAKNNEQPQQQSLFGN